MQLRWLALVICLPLVLPALAKAEEPVSIAVMEFASKGGVKQDQMDALSDLLAKEIEGLGDFRVIGKSDIGSMLNLEEQRQRLSSCDDQACLVEIGGALGVRWMVVGNVSLFGDTFLLNLKLIDVNQAKVAGRVSRSLTGGESRLIAELPSAALELFQNTDDLKPLLGETQPLATEPAPEPAAPVRQEVAAKWFSRSIDRQGRFFVFAAVGGGAFAPGSLTIGEDADLRDQGGLYPLESQQEFVRVMGGGGYHIFEWLSVSGWVAFYSSQGEGYYEDCSPEVCPDGKNFKGDLRRTRTAVEAAAEVKASWPMDFWIEPVIFLAMGSSWMQDYTPESYYPDEFSTFSDIPLDGMGLLVDAGAGVDFYLYPHLLIELRISWLFRGYGTLRGDGWKLDASMNTNGATGSLGVAWIF